MNKGLVRLAMLYGVFGVCLVPLVKDVLTTGNAHTEPTTNVALAHALRADFIGFGAEGQGSACRVFQEHPDEMWATIVNHGWDDDEVNRRTFEQEYEVLCS